MTCFSFGIRYSVGGARRRPVMIRRVLPFVSLPNDHGARDLREQGPRPWGTRLEELGHARQAARDVAGLGRFLRDAREHVEPFTCWPFFTVMMAPIWKV